MNKKEAKKILKENIARYRNRTYAELLTRLDSNDVFQETGESGKQYTIEIQVFYDDNEERNIRISGAIDDGGWSAFFPLTDSFIVAPDGSFVGE